MLPFCGYNMGDYFQHWLDVGKKISPEKRPRIYQVNWFRKAKEGKFLWPGFGENIRVLKWIFERAGGKAEATKTPLGNIPGNALDLSSLTVSMEELFKIDPTEWKKEAEELSSYFTIFGTKFPKALQGQLAALEQRLQR